MRPQARSPQPVAGTPLVTAFHAWQCPGARPFFRPGMEPGSGPAVPNLFGSRCGMACNATFGARSRHGPNELGSPRSGLPRAELHLGYIPESSLHLRAKSQGLRSDARTAATM